MNLSCSFCYSTSFSPFYNLRKLQNSLYNNIKMDPNKKPKRPPPLPSFGNSKIQQPKKDDELQKKLDSFFTQISKQTQSLKQSQITSKQPQKKQPEKPQNTAPITQSQPLAVDKKKFTLASINSKLNTMLSSKKINLNAPIVKPAQPPKPLTIASTQKSQKKRSQIPTQYDPNTPNNYDLSLHFYAQKLAELQSQSDEEQKKTNNEVINKTGLGLQKLTEQMKSEEQIPEPLQAQQEEVMEQKEQIALRMMQKFGYKVGTGLGKQSQGITTPLTIKKTTDTSCIIQQSSINLNQLIKPEISAKNALMAHGIVQTEVIVFINLIKMSQLTEEVERQLKQECSSFGQIRNWIVFLIKDNQGKEELRIFVEYGRKQDSFAAFCKLNNRYYGENLASIRFYPKDKFEEEKLNLPVHSHVET